MNTVEYQQFVRVRRDEPATALQFMPCIERLVDDDLCSSVIHIMQASAANWERYSAHDNLHTQLPDARGVYMFVWRPNIAFAFSATHQQSLPWILYVGKAGTTGGTTDTFPARFKTYQKYIGKPPAGLWDRRPPQNREERLSRYLTLRPLEYWFTAMDEATEIARLERHLIKLFRPPLNAQHARSLRPGRPIPAF
jgi:hypothetical protein